MYKIYMSADITNHISITELFIIWPVGGVVHTINNKHHMHRILSPLLMNTS